MYYSVTMALGDILRGDFFNEYIKQGTFMYLKTHPNTPTHYTILIYSD